MNYAKKTSTALSRYCNCGTSTVFRTTTPDMHNNGHVNNRVQELDTRRRSAQKGHRPTCRRTAQQRACPRPCPRRTNPGDDSTGMLTTLSKNCTTPPAPPPPYSCTIWEPTLGLPGAALDKENVRRSIFCTAQHHAQHTHPGRHTTHKHTLD